ncbi:MAG TPA: CapA family protein, partial [Alphaproteobacteria bacterium]|nr:CapA family protein [Alphaproteobacteria bacterium]
QKPPVAEQEIVVTAVGDVMLGSTFPDTSGDSLPPNDGADILKEVTPLLQRGDIVFGNLEGPLLDGGSSTKCRRPVNCYAFRVPTRYGKYLKEAGFTVMGLANNHAMDFGQEGRTSSRQTLDALEIAHSGEVGDIAHLTVKGKKVALIAFATYPGAYNLLDLDDAIKTIADARAEADLVIVSMHGGAEGASHHHVQPGDEMFLGEDRGDLRRFAHAAIDAGAQLVIGHGPHVVRGMEVYQGKLIAYSLGNFATYGSFNLNGENGLSLILEAHLGLDGAFHGGRVYPVRQEKPGGPKLDPEMSILPIVRDLSEIDFRHASVVFSMDGELRLPAEWVPDCAQAPDLDELTVKPMGTRVCGFTAVPIIQMQDGPGA